MVSCGFCVLSSVDAGIAGGSGMFVAIAESCVLSSVFLLRLCDAEVRLWGVLVFCAWN